MKNITSTFDCRILMSKGTFRLLRACCFFTLLLTHFYQIKAQSIEIIKAEEVKFESEGIMLSGTIYKPEQSHAGVILVHGSDQTPRLTEFAKLLANDGITVLTYDKRGVGESGGVYAGPEVGTNNIDNENITLLAKDASAAVNILHSHNKNLPIGLLGFSQAGWIIPIAANNNPLVSFMVLFSCPVISTLEQLRFQFYTDGRTDFWENHTEADAREHTKNDPDRYQFSSTDANTDLKKLSISGLWIFGSKDIQIPVSICMDNLNLLKGQGKPFEYALFSTLGHNTAFVDNPIPVDMALHWIRQKASSLMHNQSRE